MSKWDRQLSVLDEVDRYVIEREHREEAETIRRLDEKYQIVDWHGDDAQLPDGLVVIIQQDLFRNGRYTKHFYRTILGRHRTVIGPEIHLVADPSDEWPDVVPWAGVVGHPDWPKWNYPDFRSKAWTTGEIVEPIPLP